MRAVVVKISEMIMGGMLGLDVVVHMSVRGVLERLHDTGDDFEPSRFLINSSL